MFLGEDKSTKLVDWSLYPFNFSSANALIYVLDSALFPSNGQYRGYNIKENTASTASKRPN